MRGIDRRYANVLNPAQGNKIKDRTKTSAPGGIGGCKGMDNERLYSGCLGFKEGELKG